MVPSIALISTLRFTHPKEEMVLSHLAYRTLNILHEFYSEYHDHCLVCARVPGRSALPCHSLLRGGGLSLVIGPESLPGATCADFLDRMLYMVNANLFCSHFSSGAASAPPLSVGVPEGGA